MWRTTKIGSPGRRGHVERITARRGRTTSVCLSVLLTAAVAACGGGGHHDGADARADGARADVATDAVTHVDSRGLDGSCDGCTDGAAADASDGNIRDAAGDPDAGVDVAGGMGGGAAGMGGGDGGGGFVGNQDAGGTGGAAGAGCPSLPPSVPPTGLTVEFVPGVMVTTLAGSGNSGTGDGMGAGVGLFNPVSVATTPNGNVFVAEYDDNRIRRLTANGTSSVVIDDGVFLQPFGIVAVDNNILYVDTDRNPQGVKSTQTGTIWRVDVAARTAVVVKADVGRPRGLALLPDGRIALGDYQNHVVSVLDPQTGAVVRLAGNGCPGYADGQGTAAQFNVPYGLAVLANGTIVVADWGNHRLRTVAPDGTVGTLAGDGINGMLDGVAAQARFYRPEDVAVDGAGALYVSDQGNHRIRRLAGGRVQTLAGDGTEGFNDGTGAAAAFFGQEGLSVTSDGRTVYVTDGTNGGDGPYHRVRAVAVPPP